MSEQQIATYRAFLSYSHKDSRSARWIQKAIENYRLDKSLIGKTTRMGSIPSSLRPIFRDRDDFIGGNTLTEATITALDASSALIVVCSPHSANSEYVNEEVRLYKFRHPQRPVVPVIIGGAPGRTGDNPKIESECYCPALRYAIDESGGVTATPTAIIGIDLRPEADGRTKGLAKIVSGIIGIEPNQLIKRAEREQRQRLLNLVAGLTGLIIVLSGLTIWAELNRQEAIEQRKLAQMKQEEAEMNLNLARRAADGLVFDVAQGLRHVEGLSSEASRRILTTARAAYEKIAESGSKDIILLRHRAAMLIEFGLTHLSQGDVETATDLFRQAKEFFEANLSADRSSMKFQGDLATSYYHLGSAQFAQGDLPASLAIMMESASLFQQLIPKEPENQEWSRRLSATLSKIGEIMLAEGRNEAALEVLQRSHDGMLRVLQSKPGDLAAKRDVAIALEKLSDVFAATGEGGKCQDMASQSLMLRKQLAAEEPENIQYLQDLAMAHYKLGIAYQMLRDAKAWKEHNSALIIRQRLVHLDKDNAEYQNELAISYSKVGEVFFSMNRFEEALLAFEEQILIATQLRLLHPTNVRWIQGLASAYGLRGQAHQKLGNRREAIRDFQGGLRLIKPLAASSTNELFKRFEGAFLNSLAELE
jgi:tetratricopeptide (TPR) repeat protein